MVTDNKKMIKVSETNEIFNLNQLYGQLPFEERLKIQRISEYAGILMNYLWRNHEAVNSLTIEFFRMYSMVFQYTSSYINLKQMQTYQIKKPKPDIYEYVSCILDNYMENYDGTGTPYGKNGETIPFPAQIYRIVSDYDFLVQKNMYKPEAGNAEIIQQMLMNSDRSYKPKLITAFANCSVLLQKKDMDLGVTAI